MAIQSRRGNIANFNKEKMLPGEFGIALDSQEAFICFGAGVTKKMATNEDYQDMMDDCVTVTQTAQEVVDNFNALEVEKLAIDDSRVSTISGWSSDKITKHDTKDNAVSFAEATARENIVTGEKHGIIFGKIKKFFSDLKAVAFTGKYNDLTDVAIENATSLPVASSNTLGKIYRDGNELKITLQSGVEGSYTYSWVSFIAKDKVANNFSVTEDGFVADARTVKTLNDSVSSLNNNLVIETLQASTTIASLMLRVDIGRSKRFQYALDALPSDYPTALSSTGYIFRPLVTINRITTGLVYIEILSANTSRGIPETMAGYYNGNFYWQNNGVTSETKVFVASDFSVPVSNVDNSYAERKGNHVNLRLTFLCSEIIPQNATMIRLPEKYWPVNPVKAVFGFAGGIVTYATIFPNGYVMTDGAIPKTSWVFIYVSY